MWGNWGGNVACPIAMHTSTDDASSTAAAQEDSLGELDDTEPAVDRAEPTNEDELSKNARKRLLKAATKGARKEKRKAEKINRKEKQRAEEEAAASAGAEVVLTQAPLVVNPPKTADEHSAAAWAMWRRFGSPRLVLAPMVNQSELAFRLLSRQHGVGLTYTPMLHSRLFASSDTYRRDNFDEHHTDRPLIVQFCGDDPATLLSAARYVETRCDGVDLNCGCPQAIARSGHYGAFLLDEPELIEEIVRALTRSLSVPVSVKVRILPAADGSVDTPKTIAFCQRLEAAGASLLTVHGRTRQQKCACDPDWQTLREIKAALRIPVIANGGIETPEDLDACLEATQCDAVMTSESALENPAVTAGVPISRHSQAGLARAYIELARAHPPRCIAILKAHFFKMLYMALDEHRDCREKLGNALDAEGVFAVVSMVCSREEAASQAEPEAMRRRCDAPDAPWQTWYRRHRGAKAADPDRYGGITKADEPERDCAPCAGGDSAA